MEIKVREAIPSDFERLEEILLENDMLNREIDEKEAMQRVYKRMGRYFLVAETPEKIIGLIRGVYDGSRAMISQIAVDPRYKNRTAGNRMINEIARRFRQDGASTVSATVKKDSKNYFRHKGFIEIPITLMLHYDADSLIHNTNSS